MTAADDSTLRAKSQTKAGSRSTDATSDPKTLLFALLECESEAGVQAIISSTPFLSDARNWRYLDNRETNFNITSNQASDGGKALTELMTNMVDATLMKNAYLKNVPLTGKAAPPTMYRAVDKLIKNLRGGKLVNLEPRDPWLRDFAQKNLVIGITGAKNKDEGLPCYTFVDNGEGQHPNDFPRTFLSLSAGNKKNIPFVQGKFNMGSSGVLGYCGRRWFKLILSRRYDKSGKWGWTLLRRKPGSADDMPIAEYCVLPNGEIPSFASTDIFPFRTSEGRRYDGMRIESGTIVKLYDYQVGSRFLSFRGSREAFNENLVETILPFRLLDLRQRPDKKRGGDRALGIDARPFYGMEYLLLNSHKEEGLEDEDDAAGEGKLHVGSFSDPELGEVSISAIVLKRELPGWLRPQSSNNRVFHSVNGQVQFKQTRGYLSQSCGFPALKDRVIVVIDASTLHFSAHNEVWKGDREHLRKTLLGERYTEMVTATIKESQALKDLQAKVAQQELETAAKSERDQLFQKLVDNDPTLSALLSDRDPVVYVPSTGGSGSGGESGAGEFDGKYSPTFIRLAERFQGKDLIVPINRSRPLAARTDAENGYLQRSDNTGRIIFDDAVRDTFKIREHLIDGRLTLFLEPIQEKIRPGDRMTFHVGLADPSMAEPVFSEPVNIEIAPEEAEEKKESKKRRNGAGSGESKTGEGDKKPTRGLPPYKLLTKDGRDINGHATEQWPTGFTELDGGDVHALGDGNFLYFVNYDNSYHMKYRLKERGQVAKDVVTEKYILGMRIVMLGFEHALREKLRTGAEESFAEVVDEMRRLLARTAASTVLAIAENLPKIIDASAVQQQEDVE
jgi:hypothetical protein